MNRTGLVVIGAAVLIVGYAVIYNALTSDELQVPAFRPGGARVGFLQSLVPGSPVQPGTGAALKGPGVRKIGPVHGQGPHPQGAA